MKKTVSFVYVELDGAPVPAGKMVISEDGRFTNTQFAYGRRYLEREDAFAIDPVQLPLKEGTFETAEDFVSFNGIRDASPDRWGRLLIDRHFIRNLGRGARESEFLLTSQSGTRVGALQFGRGLDGPGPATDLLVESFEPDLGDLELFQSYADASLRDDPASLGVSGALSDYLAPGSDLGGARPKGTVTINGEPWLVKFGMTSDRINMAAAEAACLDLCEMAGLKTCERDVISIGDRPALLLKRFDREPLADGPKGTRYGRRHMISALTVLGAHESDRGASGYADIYDAIRRYGAPGQEMDFGEELFRRMVMNVLCGNTDDHYRNTAFLHEGFGSYSFSPVYDVTPSLQMLGSRYLFLHLGRGGEGREATLENALAGSSSLGVKHEDAVTIINDLSEMVARNWERKMKEHGASQRDIDLVRVSFSESGKVIEQNYPGLFPA